MTYEQRWSALRELGKKQLKYWSKETRIPAKQFIKPYRKPNTGKRIREGYQGCVQVRYHDVAIARELLAVAKLYMKKFA